MKASEVSDVRKALINAALALTTLLLTSVLWRHPLALTALLIATGVAIYALRPTRTSAWVYVVGFVFGPLAEGVSIHTGAWEYASPTFLGIPIWLPFVWGIAALFIQNTADLGKAIFARDASGTSRLRSQPASPDVVAPLAHLDGDDAPPYEQTEDRAADAEREHGFERGRHDDGAQQHVRGA
jgi:hypothetical protein